MPKHLPSLARLGRHLLLLLYPLTWVFGGLVWLRNWLYDRHLLTVRALSRPVISVGNLAMGGTGKSPVTMVLVDELQKQGYRVAVLSRGYGRKNPKQSLRVTPETHFRDGGDEPVMIARRFPESLIAVGPSRFSAAAALDEVPDIYVIDDGFQHRQLKRDLDLVLLDLLQPKPRLFPLGLFREGWRGLRRADAVILTRWQKDQAIRDWHQRIQKEKPNTPVLTCCFQPIGLYYPDGREAMALVDLEGRKIAAYAGIARPGPFFESLKSLGAKLIATKVLSDHGVFPEDDRQKWFKTVANLGASAVITTEKDAVKLDNHEGFGIELLFLSTGVVWKDPAQFLRIINIFAPEKGI